jgi:hypothetical protein
MFIFLLTILTWFGPTLCQAGGIDPLVRQLIGELAREDEIGRRIELVSDRLLGRPYITGPLLGSPESAEVLVSPLSRPYSR